jgi:hypothetical protein
MTRPGWLWRKQNRKLEFSRQSERMGQNINHYCVQSNHCRQTAAHDGLDLLHPGPGCSKGEDSSAPNQQLLVICRSIVYLVLRLSAGYGIRESTCGSVSVGMDTGRRPLIPYGGSNPASQRLRIRHPELLDQDIHRIDNIPPPLGARCRLETGADYLVIKAEL